MNKLPLVYYPATVVWVDDSQVFLEGIKISNFEPFNVRVFGRPEDCLNYFSPYTSFLQQRNFLQSCDKYEESDLIDHMPVDVDFKAINHLSNLDKRYDEVTTIIVDFDMPNINGLKLCEKLIHLPCKKILLTGVANEGEAIAAFNKRIIDCFIKKGCDDLIEETKMHLSLLTEKYFADQTAALLSHLESEVKLHFSDPEFVTFFNQWCEENAISEYYIVDKFGNMKLKNETGEWFDFIIYNDETLAKFVSINNIIDDTNACLKRIERKEKIPFFGAGINSWDVELSNWDCYLHNFETLKSKKLYFWACIPHINA